MFMVGTLTSGLYDRTSMRHLLCALVVSCVVLSGLVKAADASPGHPNILFLFSDDQRADTIGALGNAHIHTPRLDRLVAQGTAFTRAYCMGAQQGAVCVPSRAMLMTGRTLFRVKENLAGQTTWPEMFAKAGYTTFMTGKWHNGGESAERAFQRGKAIFLGGMGNPHTLPIQDISAAHKLTGKRPSGGHSVQVFADAAIEFLQERKGAAEPFLCYVAFNSPHDPRIAPPSFHDRTNADPPPVPPNFLPQHPFDNGEMTVRDEQLAPWPRTPEIVRQSLADYYACIEFVDEEVGRILDALASAGHAEDTIVVFSSDHGLAIGSHGLFGKQNLYEHSMRAPLIFAGPGIRGGANSDAFCHLLDIFPTLGELARVQGPEGSEGRSLAPILAGRETHGRDAIFTAYRNIQRAVRDERWKLIVYPQINKTQIFDLESDPIEMHDLAGEPRHAGEVARLTRLLAEQQILTDDKQLLTSEQPKPLEFDFSKVPRKKAIESQQ